MVLTHKLVFIDVLTCRGVVKLPDKQYSWSSLVAKYACYIQRSLVRYISDVDSNIAKYLSSKVTSHTI